MLVNDVHGINQIIAFRVDASDKIGTGHFMRCLTLADALKKRGARIRFVSRHLPEHLRTMLSSKGYENVLLRSNVKDGGSDDLFHARWLGTSQYADAHDTIQALSGHSWDWLVIDHYALDIRWESELRQTAKNILVIDDLADRNHDCDVLLDQNLYADMGSRYTNKVPTHCRLLLGPRYALLREEFLRLREQVKPRTGPVKRILVFFGGVDAGNYTGRAIEALAGIGISDLYVDVVIGEQYPFRGELEQICIQHGFVCHVQTNWMAELMASADLAIGAGGSATWERCCLGLPALTVSLADNQINIAKSLDLYGACRYLGPAEVATVSVMRIAIVDILKNQSKFASLSEKSLMLVDGLGACKVYEAMRC